MIDIERIQLFSKDELENAGAYVIYVDYNKVDFDTAQNIYNAVCERVPKGTLVILLHDGVDLQMYDTHDLYLLRSAIDAAIAAKVDEDFEAAKNGNLD